MAPSTFASAAAGNNNHHASARDNSSDWSRRNNGATQTFRRASGAASMSSHNNNNYPPETSAFSQPAARYVPPHRNGTLYDMRYSKDQLLDLFRSQQSMEGSLDDGLPDLYVGGWQPDVANGATASSWGRTEHSRDAQHGPDVCWDRDGMIEPLGLLEMDDEERELFSTSVNTPLKPPSTATKDSQQANGLPGRKVSVSNSANTPGGFGLPSPSMSRGQGRRRETSESFPFPNNPLASPTTNVGRDEQRAASPPPSLMRRRTDLTDFNKSGDSDKEGDDKSSSSSNPFGPPKRNPTGPLGAGFGAPSSAWTNAPASASLSPMGTFGNFGLGGAQQSASSEKRPGLASGRAESRFKNLLSKESGEEGPIPSVQRKGSMSSLTRVNEMDSWRPQDRQEAPLAEADEHLPSGSAALGVESDLHSPLQRQGLRGFGTPSRAGTQDELGFGAFGMTSDTTHGGGFVQGFLQGRDAFQQAPAAQRMGQQMSGNEPMSPTDTNPYQSPEQHGIEHLAEDLDPEGDELHNAHLPGLGDFGNESAQQLGGLGALGALPHLGRAAGIQGGASDRSQNSSAGGHRAFPSLGGLGQLGGVSGASAWPVTQGGFGTPGRQTSGLSGAFGGGIFATSMSEMQSPGLAGLGGPNMLSPGGSMGGSRMASVFSPAMQEHIRQSDQNAEPRDINTERAQQPPYVGMGAEGAQDDSSFHPGLSGQQYPPDQGLDGHDTQFGTLGQQQQLPPIGQSAQLKPQSDPQLSQQPASAASNQPPAPQQRTMVMPDRMRWIYRDPQGQTQGPWSGLEMHDWYKAGFFSPELLVKKVEDPDYEPLAQLIRRIGNSREPFLVPQIGIPHGPASSNGPPSFLGAGPTSASTAPPPGQGAQPPFASSFPSFGTTLTAEQQNALERRKQEEQYLMARQKEYLAQQQIAQRMQIQGGPSHPGLVPGGGPLHHQSSAQSLHSQPSIGSMASPSAYQPSPSQGPTPSGGSHVPGFFDSSFRAPQGGLGAVGAGVDSLGHIREEEIPGIMDRLDQNDRAAPGQLGAPGQTAFGQQQGQDMHNQQIQQMLQDRARLQQEQAEFDAMKQQQQQRRSDDQPMSNERLQQFRQLQGQMPGLDARFQPGVGRASRQQNEQQVQAPSTQSGVGSPIATQQEMQQVQEPLSLMEQVQKAASVQQSPILQQAGLPLPFPPAPAQSPLPAPAAQRTGRQSVADQLQTESRELLETPSLETPSAAIAPWAKEPAEAPRGPSLKEIQEAEAKKAAEAEEMASAARRAAFQKEIEFQVQAEAVQPGLPATASWAASGSPATPVSASAAVAWAKAAQKPTGAPAKTMAQIQKEEEARKKKLATVAANVNMNAMGSVANPAGGKSYANLASKVTSPPGAVANSGGAWTTVGAGGKTKAPGSTAVAAPLTPTAAPNRTVSSGIMPIVQPKKVPSRSSTMTNPATVNAQEEFRKWAVGELRPDLNKGISADDFVATLVFLPPDSALITEAVHGVSSTIDSRHFAEEFIRRKKLADKGLIDTSAPPKSASPHNAANNQSGGWSEVAKKGPTKEPSRDESNGNFRVVASKKKVGKR